MTDSESLRPARLTLREIRLPLREPFRISSGEVSERRILLLELADGDGITAWSECVAGEAPNYSAETVDTAWLAIRAWAAPRILGRRFRHPDRVHEELVRDFRGHAMARAAVEMAVWALEAERRGIALAELIGGVRDRVDVGISLGIHPSPDALALRARAAMEAGYRRVKLKIRPDADLEYVAAVREALGPEAVLSVDANAAYRATDGGHLARLDGYGLAMIEQPLDGEDLVRHAELQRRLHTPICLDESITSRDRAEDMITLRAGRIVNIKPGRVGGFAASKAIHDLCQEHAVPVWCGGMLESGVGRAHNVALASLPNFCLPGDLSPSARYWERDIVQPEWTMEADGTVRVPRDRPGLGVRVDAGRVDDLTVRSRTVSAR